MRMRPSRGRVGAGVLACVAALAVSQAALDLNSVPALAQNVPLPAAAIQTERPARFLGAVAQVDDPAPAPLLSSVIPAGRAQLRVPILMYHYIRVNPVASDRLGFNLSVTPYDFNAQLDWLAANGFHPVDFNDLRAYWDHDVPLPSKPIVLTFDDGYADMYTTAYPILRAHNFKGVAYIVSGFVGSKQNVSVDQVKEMDANGIQIGAHTFSHADLTKVGDAELHRQLFDSKASLEAWVGHPVVDFCYPAGQFNAKVADMVRQAGYLDATTTQPGTVHSLRDRFTWSRVRVSGGEGIGQLAADLGQPEPTVQTATPAPPHKVTYSMLPKLPLIVGSSVLRALLPELDRPLRAPSFR